MKARLYKYMYITIAVASMCHGCLVALKICTTTTDTVIVNSDIRLLTVTLNLNSKISARETTFLECHLYIMAIAGEITFIKDCYSRIDNQSKIPMSSYITVLPVYHFYINLILCYTLILPFQLTWFWHCVRKIRKISEINWCIGFCWDLF